MDIFVVQMFVILILGLVIGSFLNVCICRIPKNLSIIWPASRCQECGTQLCAADLVPVLSYVLLRGRCRYCGKGINIRYPLVEGITSCLFILVYIRFGLSIDLLFWLIFVVIAVPIFFIDLEHQIIPDHLNYAGIALGLLYGSMTGGLLSSFIGMIAGGVVMYLIFVLGTAIYKREAMGGGDIKLAMMLGAYFGWKNIILVLFLSFIIGAAAALILIALKIKNRQQEIPFGPAMLCASFVVVFFADNIWKFYLGF
jgi:leader peptidase (prepilin peptidase) / N-methyltransferase